jgi:hypothetical protein
LRLGKLDSIPMTDFENLSVGENYEFDLVKGVETIPL